MQALFLCLAQPAVVVTAEGAIQPYSELTSVYSPMQTQAQVLNMLTFAYAKVRPSSGTPDIAILGALPNCLQCTALIWSPGCLLW